jgi:hypothetical protein
MAPKPKTDIPLTVVVEMALDPNHFKMILAVSLSTTNIIFDYWTLFPIFTVWHWSIYRVDCKYDA